VFRIYDYGHKGTGMGLGAWGKGLKIQDLGIEEFRN
jgi:hypothetical protein